MRVALVAACMLPTLGAGGQPADVGAWRRVSDSKLEQQFHFSMLPHAAAVGTRWAVYDAQAGNVVCCLSVAGTEVSEDELRDRFDIPGPWITDLTNGWNPDAAPYRPHVQLLTVQGALGSYTFKDAGDAAGGLLLPIDARGVGARTLEMSGRRYAVRTREASLADDDGGVLSYILTPLDGGGVLRVDVPFGTY